MVKHNEVVNHKAIDLSEESCAIARTAPLSCIIFSAFLCYTNYAYLGKAFVVNIEKYDRKRGTRHDEKAGRISQA